MQEWNDSPEDVEAEVRRELRRDNEHLRLLRTFHFVVAGLTAFFGCFTLPHAIIGLVMLTQGNTLFTPRASGTTSTTTTLAAPSTGGASAAGAPAPGTPATTGALVATPGKAPPPGMMTFMGTIFAAVGFGWFLWSEIVALLFLYAAKLLRERRRHRAILVIAVVGMLAGLFGMVLGIFTLIVLVRPSVRNLFQAHALQGS